MSENILETIIKKVFDFQKDVFFTWHGGEPLLPGLQFYENAINIINKYKTSVHTIKNYIQTNATLITPKIANFLKNNNFIVSVSIDGSELVHNLNRINYNNMGSFQLARKGVNCLRKVNLNPPVIATVTKETLKYSKDTFRFLTANGFTNIKYSPVYDSESDSFSINSKDWFRYLKDVLYEWFKLKNPNINC